MITSVLNANSNLLFFRLNSLTSLHWIILECFCWRLSAGSFEIRFVQSLPFGYFFCYLHITKSYVERNIFQLTSKLMEILSTIISILFSHVIQVIQQKIKKSYQLFLQSKTDRNSVHLLLFKY